MKVFFVILLTFTIAEQKKKKIKTVTERPEYDFNLDIDFSQGDSEDPTINIPFEFGTDERKIDSFFKYKMKNGGLDMNGTIRKFYAITAALTTPSNSSVCSPLSALLPVAKIALGASGKTQTELLAAVGATERTLPKAIEDIIKGLQTLPGVRLNIASTIFMSQKHELDPKFKELTEKVFQSCITQIDFNNPSEAASRINAWVYAATETKIKDMIGPGEISPATSAVVVNAIFFQGNWADSFNKTFPGTFFGTYTKRTETMMYKETYYMYADVKELDAQIIEIPYAENQSAFVVILPKAINGLGKLMEKIKSKPELLDEALRGMGRRRVQLTLPKFKIESEWDLKALFEKLHIKRMFSHKSELDKILKREKVIISKAKQKAIIEVDQYGTTAAAATGMEIMLLSAPTAPVQFKAEHPFFYMLRAGTQQLFAGVFC